MSLRKSHSLSDSFLGILMRELSAKGTRAYSAGIKIAKVFTKTESTKLREDLVVSVDDTVFGKAKDDNAITDLQIVNGIPYLLDNSHSLVTYWVGHFGAGHDAMVDVKVSAADSRCGNADDGVFGLLETREWDVCFDSHLIGFAFPDHGAHGLGT
ncbi:hypothetical protein JMJ77_0005961 [Colletotrichum scovillei]|uniref:Uncharacterized protein n=1 Tax=Colletotrichum scovillei TaxID=1209932 RepID=A0A9P7RJY3_9PEZI|nr:hypothetical protein JMJ77_0005961 [Colletotrichum scovillei]KAG7077245.1 hypothetical protein JMJ76_0014495 [Colletotrichum scovillei]KAG7084302.1 hypothetical protein JMJ78_0009739 [Colletotrichum scovillei]